MRRSQRCQCKRFPICSRCLGLPWMSFSSQTDLKKEMNSMLYHLQDGSAYVAGRRKTCGPRKPIFQQGALYHRLGRFESKACAKLLHFRILLLVMDNPRLFGWCLSKLSSWLHWSQIVNCVCLEVPHFARALNTCWRPSPRCGMLSFQ